MSTHPPENPRSEARPATPAVEKRTGLTFRRYFTKQGRHPYDDLAWETRSAVINDERGRPGRRPHLKTAVVRNCFESMRRRTRCSSECFPAADDVP